MPLHFKDMEAFRKYNAYRFIHGIKTKHHKTVYIGGKKHHVKHAKPGHRQKVRAMLDYM